MLGFPGGSDNKESTCNEEDLDLIPGWGRCPGGGHGNRLLKNFFSNSCLKNPRTKEPGGLQSMGSQSWDMTEQLSTAILILCNILIFIHYINNYI